MPEHAFVGYLRQKLLELGINQTDLASRMGVHKNAVSQLFSGKTKPNNLDFNTIMKIAGAIEEDPKILCALIVDELLPTPHGKIKSLCNILIIESEGLTNEDDIEWVVDGVESAIQYCKKRKARAAGKVEPEPDGNGDNDGEKKPDGGGETRWKMRRTPERVEVISRVS